MILSFTHNYKILTVDKASHAELEQLTKITTGKGFNFGTKETYEKCFFNQLKYIPAGFWREIYNLKTKNWNVLITNLTDLLRLDVDKDEFVLWCEQLPIKWAPYPYQTEAAYRAYKYRTARFQIGTGGGKSLAQYLISRFMIQKILDSGQVVMMIVPRVILCHQMHKDFNEYQETDPDAPIIVDRIYGGSKRVKDANVIVGNIDSLVNMPRDFFDNVGCLLIDEGHKLGSSNQYRQVIHYLDMNKVHTIATFSGTFDEGKSIDAKYQTAYGGPVIMDLPVSDLQELGTVAKIDITVAQMDHDHSTSYGYYNHPDIDKINGRFKLEMDYIKDIEKRFDVITKTIERIEGNQVLLFNSRSHLSQFKDYLEANMTNKRVFEIHGDVPQNLREEICDLAEEIDNIVICATFATLDTGVSIKNITNLHLIDSCKSFVRVVQSIGRAIRLHPNKEFAKIWDWVDHFVKQRPSKKNPNVQEWPGPSINIAYRHGKTRQKIYKNHKYPFTVKRLKL